MRFIYAMAVAIAMAGLQTQESPVVPYPSGYRGWTMVKTFVVTAESKLFQARGGFHHYFANDQALEGYRTETFPEGSVIVDEGVRAKGEGGLTIETTLRSVEVMHKDPRYQATGGWGYDRFEGDSTEGSGGKAQAGCFACHDGAKQRDYVFSTARVTGGSKR